MMSGENRAGHLAYKTYTSLLDKVRDKLKVGTKVLDLDTEIEEVSFHNIKLGKLLINLHNFNLSGHAFKRYLPFYIFLAKLFGISL